MTQVCPSCNENIEFSNGEAMKFCPLCGGKFVADTKEKPQKEQCPICCVSIEDEDETIACPDCGMSYHRECWDDNNGCATYGCKSAGCLNPPPERIEIDNDVPGNSIDSNKKINCPTCGVGLSRDETFCWSCGAVLHEHSGAGTTFKLSGLYDPLHLLGGLLLSIPAILVLSLVYAYVVHYITIIYFAAAATVFFGIITGWISHYVWKFTKTRNLAWGFGISLILTFLAVYFSWAFCIGIYFENTTLDPFAICNGIGILAEKHSFNVSFWRSSGKNGIPISGVFLSILYFIELGIIMVGGLLTAWGLNSSIGFCEKCRKWTKETFKSPSLEPVKDANQLLVELQNGNISPLLNMNRIWSQNDHTTLVIQSCECSDLSLLSVNHVTVTMKDNKPEESSSELISQVIISFENANKIKNASWQSHDTEKQNIEQSTAIIN